jgi:hypothetical protein
MLYEKISKIIAENEIIINPLLEMFNVKTHLSKINSINDKNNNEHFNLIIAAINKDNAEEKSLRFSRELIDTKSLYKQTIISVDLLQEKPELKIEIINEEQRNIVINAVYKVHYQTKIKLPTPEILELKKSINNLNVKQYCNINSILWNEFQLLNLNTF